jgi:hypothetical protein
LAQLCHQAEEMFGLLGGWSIPSGALLKRETAKVDALRAALANSGNWDADKSAIRESLDLHGQLLERLRKQVKRGRKESSRGGFITTLQTGGCPRDLAREIADAVEATFSTTKPEILERTITPQPGFLFIRPRQ